MLFDLSLPSFNVVMGTLKMRDLKMRHQTAGMENAELENAAPICRGGKCET